VLSVTLHKLQTTDDEYLTVYHRLSTGTTWPNSAHDNHLPFATPVRALRSLEYVMTQQFLTDMHDYCHFVVQYCAKTTLSDKH